MYTDISSDLVFIALGDKVGYRLFVSVFGVLKQDKNFQVFCYKALWEVQKRDGGLTNKAYVSWKIISPSVGSVLNRVILPNGRLRLMPMNLYETLSFIGNSIIIAGTLHNNYQWIKYLMIQ
jgi:hypothetical protein